MPTWKETLYPHVFLGHIEVMRHKASEMGYKYFCWNDRIYKTNDSSDTGYIAEEIK